MMRAAKQSWVLALLGSGLAACSMLQPQPPAPLSQAQIKSEEVKPAQVIEQSHSQLARGEDVEQLLQYFEKIRTLPPPELNKEHERIRQGFATDKGDFVRLQLALFSVVPGAPAGERARGLAVLDAMLKEKPAATATRSFALLLHAILTEHKKLEDGMQGLSLKVKDGLRREEALQQKLDALNDVESTLMERERTRPAGKK